MTGHPDGSGEATAVDQLCDHVVHQYHEVLRHELPALARLFAALPDGATIAELRRSLAALSAVLEPHLAKEENIVFPALKQLAEAARGAQAWPALPSQAARARASARRVRQ